LDPNEFSNSLDPDPDSSKFLDPDLVNPDPKQWYFCMCCICVTFNRQLVQMLVVEGVAFQPSKSDQQGWAKLVLIALERYSVALKRLTFNLR